MKKYRLVIAEDEPYAARYIRATVQSTALYDVIECCENAEDALEFLQKNDADVLITDIKMSGMTGIELLQQLHDLRPNLKSIIISGYSDFEFAKEAIALGVSDYILKPLNSEELTHALERLYGKLEQQTQRSWEDLLKSLNQESALTLDNPYRLPFSHYHVLLMAGTFNLENLIVFLKNEFEKVAAGNLKFVLYRYSLAILDGCGNTMDNGRMKSIANATLRHFQVSGETGLLVYSETPLESRNLSSDLRKFYGFHQRSMVFGRSACIPYSDAVIEPTYDVSKEKSIIENLIQTLNVRNDKDFYRHLRRLFDFWYANDASVRSIKQAVYNIIIHLFHLDSSNIDPIIEINKIMAPLYRCRSFDEAQQCVSEAIEPLLSRMHNERSNTQSHSQQIYWSIISYLNMNIKRNFSLQEISDTFGVSQPYVSKLFRMYSGSSYKEYITNRKISMAIQLMEQNENMLIKDIAEEVGYDQLYFSTVFCRITGEYPKQYREKIAKK